MRVVMATCYTYRDTWTPFLELFKRFYGGELYVLTDQTDDREWPQWAHVLLARGTWCQMLAQFARMSREEILLLQDDFFLNEPANHALIREALNQLLTLNAGCVRLYPCPGGDIDYGDPHYAEVRRDAAYRISCQAALWKSDYLATVAAYAEGSAADFEIKGTAFSRTLPEPVLAFKRDVQPWPLSYLCTAIVRAEWTSGAKVLCDRLGIQVDWSMRPMAA